jgi:hypothetical protein
VRGQGPIQEHGCGGRDRAAPSATGGAGNNRAVGISAASGFPNGAGTAAE